MRALRGLVGTHQHMLIDTLLRHIDFLDQQIARLDEEVKERMRPFEHQIELLDTIPGIGRRNAEVILACAGPDMSRFPSAAHFSSWSGVAPGNNESAGKRKPTRTREGNPLLRTTLVQSARAAARTRKYLLICAIPPHRCPPGKQPGGGGCRPYHRGCHLPYVKDREFLPGSWG